MDDLRPAPKKITLGLKELTENVDKPAVAKYLEADDGFIFLRRLLI